MAFGHWLLSKHCDRINERLSPATDCLREKVPGNFHQLIHPYLGGMIPLTFTSIEERNIVSHHRLGTTILVKCFSQSLNQTSHCVADGKKTSTSLQIKPFHHFVYWFALLCR